MSKFTDSGYGGEPACVDSGAEKAFTSNELTQDPLEGHTAFELRCAKAEIGRLRAVLERAERVSAMVNALPVTTEELRRIRNAGKITWDKMVNLLTSCLIDMREASTSSPSETSERRCHCGKLAWPAGEIVMLRDGSEFDHYPETPCEQEEAEGLSVKATVKCEVCGQVYEPNDVDAVQHVCSPQNGS